MILVFGKTGQVAQELQTLTNVMALDRTQANLQKPNTCVDAIYSLKPKAVINAAAYTKVDKAETEEDIATDINGNAPGVIAAACASRGIPIIQISKDYVFDGSGQHAWRTSDPTNPQSAYGRSKLKGERAVLKSGANHAILRTSWVFSEHGKNFVKTLLQLSSTRDSLNIVNDQIGGPTPATDVARACLKLAEQLIKYPEKTGTYHLSGMPEISWCGFAKLIFDQAKCNTKVNPIHTSEYPTPAKRPLNSRLDCSNIKKAFNIDRPKWRDALRDILTKSEIRNGTT